MSLGEIQKKTDEFMSQFKEGYWTPMEMLAAMVEEMGEVAREVNHLYGPKKKKDSEETKELAEELGCLVFSICCMANALGIDLDEAFEKTVEKFNRRDRERFERV